MNGQPAHGLYPDQQNSPGHDHIFSERNQRVDQTRLRPDFEAQMVYGINIFSVFAAALLLLIFIWFIDSS